MLYALTGTGITATLLALVQIWTSFLEWDDFIKTLITLVIIGSIISFLTAVEYDLPAMRSKILFSVLVALVVAIAGLVIIQLWWIGFEWGIFAKVVVSLGLVTVLVAFMLAVSSDFSQHKNLRDKNYID